MVYRIYDEMTVAAPGNLGPVRLPIAASSVRWGLNDGGALSAFVRLDDLRAAGLIGDLKGYWVQYATSAGPFGGIITGQPTTGNYMEISAEGFLSLVKGRMVNQRIVAMGGSAGGLAKRALSLAGAGNPTFIDLGDIDEGGGALSIELTGDVATDILPQIAEAGDVEWVVTADRVFNLARRLGNDLSSIVRLVEDRHIIEARVNDDLAATSSGSTMMVQSALSQSVMGRTRTQPPANDPVIQPPNNPAPPPPAPPPPTPPVITPTQPPVRTPPRNPFQAFVDRFFGGRFGRPAGTQAVTATIAIAPVTTVSESWQAQLQTYTIEAPGTASTPGTNASPAPWRAVVIGIGANNPAVASKRHAPPPTVPVELTLANVDNCFRAFDIGDTVRIDLGSVGVTGRFRIMSKSLDVASQALTVAGELLKDY